MLTDEQRAMLTDARGKVLTLLTLVTGSGENPLTDFLFFQLGILSFWLELPMPRPFNPREIKMIEQGRKQVDDLLAQIPKGAQVQVVEIAIAGASN